MKILKGIFIGIPNIPLIIVILIYVLYNLFKHTGVVEMQMQTSFLTKEIEEYLLEMFPRTLFVTTAIMFWSYILIKFIL